jgi:2-iminoacetate synthase
MIRVTMDNLDAVFRSEDRGLLEELARAARDVTQQNFGKVVSLYAPLYISNYCQNRCVYCGFNAGRAEVARKKLTLAEIEAECAALAGTGIRSILMLTGESRLHSPPSYIAEAVGIAARHFPNVALEVYAMETEEYRQMYHSGVDGVTMFQETYDRKRYGELHLAGPKMDYDYRVNAPERMALGGIRHIGMGALLGLADWRIEVRNLFRHVRYLEKKYPGVEYTLSFPRIRPVARDDRRYFPVSDLDMVKIVAVGRLLFPRAGINLSTRETAEFRDRIVRIGVTKMSAGSVTSVGGYAAHDSHESLDGQFEVHDRRNVAEIKTMLKSAGFDPVVTDWRNIVNE